jgi:hypothetical protein
MVRMMRMDTAKPAKHMRLRGVAADGRPPPSTNEGTVAPTLPFREFPAFAVCVAIASIRGGDKQSYGSSFNSISRARTTPISSGFAAPDSMIDETNAANSGAAQPLSFDNSTCTKSSP